MPFVRVLSKMIDDGEHNEDPKSKLVFHLRIDSEGEPILGPEAFGYNECWGEGDSSYKKYPFILKCDRKQEIPYQLDYAGWDEESDDRVNLHLKRIREGEFFTLFELSERPVLESIYRIISVSEL